MAKWFPHAEYTPYINGDGMLIPLLSVAALASASTDGGHSTPFARPERSSSSHLYMDDESSGSSSRSSKKRSNGKAPVDATVTDPAATPETSTMPERSETAATQVPSTAPEQPA